MKQKVHRLVLPTTITLSALLWRSLDLCSLRGVSQRRSGPVPSLLPGEQIVRNAEQAAEMAGWLGAEVAVPMHYRFKGSWFTDSFILSYDGTPQRFLDAAKKVASGTRATVLEPGEVLSLTR
jgi:hypothetical protein